MQIDDQHTSVYDFVTDGTPTDVVARYASLKTQALHADYGDLDRNIVVIDTETTGVSERKDELTQIAAARLERGEITEWFVTFVNPGKPIPDEISHLTNIFDTDVADAPTPVETCEQLAHFVGDATLVAHNAAFDRHFVTKNAGGACLKENLWIDSLAHRASTFEVASSDRFGSRVRRADFNPPCRRRRRGPVCGISHSFGRCERYAERFGRVYFQTCAH